MTFQSKNVDYDMAIATIIVYTTNVELNVYTNSSIFLQAYFEYLGGKRMADTKQTQEDEAMQEVQAEQDQVQDEQSQTNGIPDYKSDREEVRHASEQFFRSLFRAGVHVAMAPVYVLPEESREHFFAAGREFTRGLSSLAQEIADDFDKLVTRENEKLGNE